MQVLRGFEYRGIDSPVHRLDPRVKLIYSLCSMILVLIYTNGLVLAAIFLTSMPFVLLGHVMKRWLQMLKGLIPLLVLIFAVNVLFAPNVEGMVYATSMTLRFLALSSTFSIVFLTTAPDTMAMAFVKMGIPYEYTLAFTMAVRFIPTLARDLQRIIDAQRSRGLELEKGNILRRIRNFIPILVPLMVYEIRRSFQIAESMESRGFGFPRRRTFLHEVKFSRNDYLVLMLTLMFFSALIMVKIVLRVS
ncbi:MAG: energy-coupling factor transporter transmembrane protein EcfT [Thermoprotei archaeon]|nr:energy-coupling factor transporter transmembrane protein EcfT [Thermoprotei archaeon]